MKYKVLLSFLLLFSFLSIKNNLFSQPDNPVRIAVAGLSHDHVHWLFGRDNNINDVEITGIYEPDERLWQRYKEMYDLDANLHYTNLGQMLNHTQPEAVTAFGPTYDHLSLVEVAAPMGIHVMVEKPLAVNLEHATKMKKLADEHSIQLITNYETSWYASNHELYRLFKSENQFGKIRKIEVNDGHQGPKEIGVSDGFLEWLTDPVLNGGGALMDFGCYGANLVTWLMDGKEPESVTAVTQTFKPGIYSKVDDEATIILTYPGTQAVIQASWNWPYGRKDMQVYGQTGYINALNASDLQIKENEESTLKSVTLQPRQYPYNDPFSYLAGVVKGKVELDSSDLSSLENNITVMKILDAAKQSAKSGKTIYLNQ